MTTTGHTRKGLDGGAKLVFSLFAGVAGGLGIWGWQMWSDKPSFTSAGMVGVGSLLGVLTLWALWENWVQGEVDCPQCGETNNAPLLRRASSYTRKCARCNSRFALTYFGEVKTWSVSKAAQHAGAGAGFGCAGFLFAVVMATIVVSAIGSLLGAVGAIIGAFVGVVIGINAIGFFLFDD